MTPLLVITCAALGSYFTYLFAIHQCNKRVSRYVEAKQRLVVENDRLQHLVKHLEAKLQSIANQYAVDCL